MTPRGSYQRGQKDQMTDEWKELVRARMKELGITHRELEDRAGTGGGQIAKMLTPGQNTSVWVRRVAEVLGLPMPGRATTTEEILLLENFRSAAEPYRAAIQQHAAAAAAATRAATVLPHTDTPPGRPVDIAAADDRDLGDKRLAREVLPELEIYEAQVRAGVAPVRDGTVRGTDGGSEKRRWRRSGAGVSRTKRQRP